MYSTMGDDYWELSNYIEGYWPKLRQEITYESKTALGLPNPYYVPSVEVVDGFSFPHMFYWDTYFMIQGFWGTSREQEIVGLLNNMFDMVLRFGFVPNSNSFSHLSRSQPPLLSTLTKQAFERVNSHDHEWLLWAYRRTNEEYKTVWMGRQQPHNRKVYKSLSRYYDTNVLHVLAEAESGWDYTTRFENRCMNYLPIDLNSLLYKYSTDLAWMAGTLGKHTWEDTWSARANRRRDNINNLMWDEQAGLYYDYNYKTKKRGEIKSLATYVPMFANMCTPQQAYRLVENLELFETDHGLSTTALEYEPVEGKQWAAPNGWAPLHDFVVDGLLNYGYEEEAKRIAKKWVDTVDMKYKKTGLIFEKYNVVNPDSKAEGAVYPDQHGFGWTNGVTFKFIQLLK